MATLLHLVNIAYLTHFSIQDPDDAVIEVQLAGLCGSDLHIYRGNLPFHQPYVNIIIVITITPLSHFTLYLFRFVMGHEVYGTIVRLGTSFAHTSEIPNPPQTSASKGWDAPRAYLDLKVGDKVRTIYSITLRHQRLPTSRLSPLSPPVVWNARRLSPFINHD